MRTYSLLANTMAKHPAMQIFRRFSDLNVKSILYYEAELAFLAEELEEVEGKDHQTSDLLRERFEGQWLSLAYGDDTSMPVVGQAPSGGMIEDPPDEAENGSRLQWKLICRVRKVLDAYCKMDTINSVDGD